MRERIERSQTHPLQIYHDIQLIRRYRLNGESIRYIADLIRQDITPKGNNNNPIDPIDIVCTNLHSLATGCFQRTDGDTLGISQASVSRIVEAVCKALTAELLDFIHLPQEQQQRVNIHVINFYHMVRFPGMLGVIDGTHVKIQAPREDEHQYVNCYHSINVQVVMDADAKIINVNAQWPGSVHDSR